jgi:hypothetical protein
MACPAPAGCTKLRDAALDPLRPTLRGANRSRSSGPPPLDGMLGEGISPRPSKSSSRKSGPTSAAIAAQRLGGGRVAATRRRDDPGFVGRLRARLPRIRPFKLLTVSAFGVALVGIVANAMVFQHGHHPAPLFGFGGSIDGRAEPVQHAAAEPSAAASAPVPAPAAPIPAVNPPIVAPPPVPSVVVDPVPRAAPAAPKPIVAHHTAPKPHGTDAIGNLLSTAAPSSAAHPRPGHVAAKAASAASPSGSQEAAHLLSTHAKSAVKPDHKAVTTDSGTALAYPASQAHSTAGAAAHVRPQAGKTGSKVEPTAKSAAAND